jgi:hypothetical protein
MAKNAILKLSSFEADLSEMGKAKRLVFYVATSGISTLKADLRCRNSTISPKHGDSTFVHPCPCAQEPL